MNFIGKTVLVIGSGPDLTGRKMGARIDGGEWDVVCRVNHKYGSDEDTGTRTDIIFSRFREWDKKYWGPEYVNVQRVITNEDIGLSRREINNLEFEIFKRRDISVSIGAIAVNYFIIRGAKSVSVIGFGYKDGKFPETKKYADGTIDKYPGYAVQQENPWLQKWAILIP